MKFRKANVAILVGLAAWSQACGDDDDNAVIPTVDAGADAGHDAGAHPVDAGFDSGHVTPPPSGFDSGSPLDAGTDSGGGPTTLDGGACDGGALSLGAISPQFGATDATTAITVTGAGFVSTPRVYLVDSAGAITPATNAGFVSSTSVTALVPSGLAVGHYEVVVVNPGECAGTLGASFDVVANPAPFVLSFTPAHGTTQTDATVSITGCHFPANATLATLDESGTLLTQAVTTAPAAGANDARCNGTPLFTMAGTIQTKTQNMLVGAYVVRVGNPTDATFGEYASFVISNPSGNLSGGWQTAAPLGVGRRALGLVTARLDDAHRFIYAIGGEDSTGAPLDSVEVAAIDRFGKIGTWSKQKNALKTARAGLAVAQRGLHVYAIGGTGSTNGTGGASPTGTPLASIERAKLLEPTGAPKLAAAVTSTTTGALAKGTFYYRVAAVLDASSPATQGETLASEESVATLDGAGQVTLSWTAPAVGVAASYRVYRTATGDGASGTEVLLASGITGTTFTDDGTATAGTDLPLAVGSLGPWVTNAITLGHARLDATGSVALDPSGAAHVYAIGGWGQCGVTPAAAMDCYEYASLSADGATLGAFVTGPTTLGKPRLRAGSDIFASAANNFVVVAGGKGNSGPANTTETAEVLATGVLGAWSNPGGFSNERDGTQLLVANGFGYALFGGSQTADQSSTGVTTATTLGFPNWSNAGANLGTKIGRHGAAAESAYFYVAGGTTNDADALTTVYRILH